MLFGNCYISIIGADLDPDIGMLHEGRAGLVYDLIDSLKVKMIDSPVFNDICNILTESDWEYSDSRCILSESLMKTLTQIFRKSLDQNIIDEQVRLLKGALQNENKIQILS
jgi:CRISPR/Cas system-associated endonuclease Cas1